MPIFMKIEGVDGNASAAGATGGVWKTADLLTNDPVRRSGGGPHINVLSGSAGASLIPLSRISLTPGGMDVEARDPSARLKLERVINIARGKAPGGKLYVTADAGVFQSSTHLNAQGRLLIGGDQGVRQSGGANKFNGSNNIKQLALPASSRGTVEIVFTDMAGRVTDTHRVHGVSVSGSSGTFTLTFNGQTAGGF